MEGAEVIPMVDGVHPGSVVMPRLGLFHISAPVAVLTAYS